MTMDQNKNISNISYNYLNLPDTIEIKGKGLIIYFYDASGNKLQKKTIDNMSKRTTVTSYVGSAIFQNDSLQYLSQEEGRVRVDANNTGYIFDYYIKDHLGNTRMVLTDDYARTNPILESTHYYPFGLTMDGISTKAAGKLENKNDKFQGEPLDDDLGLNWYGFKFRNHDPQIGRFIQIDPLTEKYVYNSTYAFSENKVTNHVELEGLESANANDVRNPYIRAALKDNVQKDLSSMRRNGSEAVQVKGSVGVGVGIQVKVTKKAELDLSISGPQTEGVINGAGKVDAKASLVGTGGKVSIPGLEVGVGAEAGAVQYADGKFSVNAVATGADINSSKSKTDGNLSQGGEVSAFDAAITVGAKLGVGGVSLTVDVIKAGKAVVDFFKAGANWMSNVVKDKAPSHLQKPDLNNQ